VTAGVHCNLAVNPLSVEAQIQGAAPWACHPPARQCDHAPGDGVVEQNNFGEYRVARLPDMPRIAAQDRAQRRPADRLGEPGPPPWRPPSPTTPPPAPPAARYRASCRSH
jgi:isoquinoline 1-oxidoreductase beta subunit